LQEKEKNHELEKRVLKSQYVFQTNTMKNYDDINKEINRANEELTQKLKVIESVSLLF
jgi:hypothetical protein